MANEFAPVGLAATKPAYAGSTPGDLWTPAQAGVVAERPEARF